MEKLNPYPHARAAIIVTAAMSMLGGFLLARATYEAQPDYSRLTLEACSTEQECSIAEAIASYEGATTIPTSVLEPVDCSDQYGGDHAVCEYDNQLNAGEPVEVYSCS